MKSFYKLIAVFFIISNALNACDALKHKSLNLDKLIVKQKSAHILPELINELRDFQNLIPQVVIDEIIAKHYFLDGRFRTALKYLRSQEFTQLQRRLLDVPEIIDVLEFLHLTAENATTRHMGATKIATSTTSMSSLDEYNDYAVAEEITTSNGNIIVQPQTLAAENAKEEVNNFTVPKRPQEQFYIKEHSTDQKTEINDDDEEETANANSIAFNKEQPLVHIVLLEDLDVKANKYKRRRHNRYHHRTSLGTFTTFLEEVLQHLPNSAYQNMIKDKCQKNPKFSLFYQALRSPEFKPLIEQAKSTPNIQRIISNLNLYDVDVNSLEPIFFKVISWGPNI